MTEPDPSDPSDLLEGVEVYVDDDLQTLVGVHRGEDCRGPCPMHRPSDHHMRSWPLVYRFDRGMFERRCVHGVGHPDPDSLARMVEFFEREGDGIHGCCGCCAPPAPD